MAGAQRYALVFAPEAVHDLDAIDCKHHLLIRRQIRLQLTGEPEAETRNRKPVEVPTPFGGQWELRFGPRSRFRVFYEVDQDARPVRVLAIGTKDQNVHRIGREEYGP